jgi:hypothetical protein
MLVKLDQGKIAAFGNYEALALPIIDSKKNQESNP